MVVVLAKEKLRGEDGGVKLFIRSEGGLGMFQILLRDPGIFFSGVSLPSDQEGTGSRGSVMVYDLLNFVFFFSIDKIRRWCREVLSVDFIFAIRR